MKTKELFVPGMIAGCAGLLLILVAGCDKTTAGGGTGGSLGSGGSSVVGSGGSSVVGPGGSSVAGFGGSVSGGTGGNASGGSGGGSGGRGSGGATGTGGGTAAGDAAIADAALRDASGRDARMSRDAPVDAPASQPDANVSTGSDGGCVPDYACKPTSPNTGDPYADCVARVNQFRACVCLPPLARWTAGEACADQDAQYDSQQNTAHAGAQANICDWGNAQDECPDWTRSTNESVIDGCLQMMFDEGPPPSGSCTGQCYSDHGHYINMTGTGYRNGVACGFYTTSSGAVWATQNFK